MTFQNRVTPFGDIVAIPQRGMFTGNRGILHDPATKTMLRRRWTNRAWLICTCEFGDRRRIVMGGRSWTELFFLDEAVALAAGHRPCFFCRRPAAEAFRTALAKGLRTGVLSAPQIDSLLHAERLDGRAKRLHVSRRTIASLPDGAMIAQEDRAFAVVGGLAYPWTENGYGTALSDLGTHLLVTPPATLLALDNGYRAALHPSVAGAVTNSR